MNVTPVFDRSFLAPSLSELNFDFWPTVTKTWEEKRYKDTIHAVLDYVKPNLSQRSLDPEKTKYAIPHGSIKVYLAITDTHLIVSAPFLKIPARSLLALMRQVAELNFGTMVLAQVNMRGDEMHFEYKCPVELCEPYKLYYLFDEICFQADSKDDEYIEKFGAQRIAALNVQRFTPEEIDMCYAKFRAYLEEGLAYQDYWEGKRIQGFAWDCQYLSLVKIDYMMRPQGILKSEIARAIRTLTGQAQMTEILSKTRATMQKMLEWDKEKFAESMYHGQQFVSDKSKMELPGVQNYFKNTHSNAKAEIDKTDYAGACLSLYMGFFGIIYYNNIPENVHQKIVDTLASNAQMGWKDAAINMWSQLDSIMAMTEDRFANNTSLRKGNL